MISIRLQRRIRSSKHLDSMNDWLAELPYTKRGRRAYRICNKNGLNYHRLPVIVFVRRDDALTFKLKFDV